MLYPIIPSSSKKALSFFNIDIKNVNFENFTKINNKDLIISNPKPLFPRIEL